MLTAEGRPHFEGDISNELFSFATGRHGKFFTLRHDTYVSRSIETYGEWCEAELSLLAQVLGPGDIVVDAGANIGTHSLAFAAMVGPTGRVYAFEPQPVVHRALAANIMINDANQAFSVNAALGAEAGTAPFVEINYGADVNFGAVTLAESRRLADTAQDAPRLTVPVMRLDDVLNVPRLKLIKCDIEGMEPEMLDGAAETLRRHRPYLYLECETPKDAPPLFDALARHGYQGYWHASLLHNPENWNGVTNDVFEGAACVNMFCAPQGVSVDGLPKATPGEPHPRGE